MKKILMLVVALAVSLLSVPANGIAQTQAERELLQLYESRERELSARIDSQKKLDEQQLESVKVSCLSRSLLGDYSAYPVCLRELRELTDQMAQRYRSLEDRLFDARQERLRLERSFITETRTPTPRTAPSISCRNLAMETPLANVRACVDQGSAVAQINLGIMYANGEGVPQDYVEAVRLYRLATDQGAAEAQYNLGIMYANGNGVPEDDVEAARWFRLAADQGVTEAQYNLGIMYANGNGVPEDDVEAARWFRLAADQGFASAQYNIGYMYANGNDVPEDDVEAVRWFRLAADQGDSDAQVSLGISYVLGEGVPKDDVQAYMWFNLAAAQGKATAREARSRIEKSMTREQIAEGQRMSREWIARHPPE
jgi:hypothetical protein